MQTYGEALPDQVERVGNFFDAQLGLINEVRDIYRDRSALERDYAAKLQALARKAEEKKERLQSQTVVGEDPTKVYDESTLRQSTLHNAYAQIISSIVDTAQDHIDIADSATNQVTTALKGLERKTEEQKKKIMQFYQKVLSDRDRTYGERVKSKHKYDEECEEVETYRQKQNRAHDDRHSERAARQAEQQRIDMLNSKNIYLMSIAIANKAKDKFYFEDLPSIENELQAFQGNLIERFIKILLHCQALHLTHLDNLKGRVEQVEKALGTVDSAKDQSLFIDHNIRPFTAPADWSFEPCASHYDTGEMSIEAAPKVFLQNKLSKSRARLAEITPLLEAKRKELAQLEKLVEAYTADHSLGNLDEIYDQYLDTKHAVISYSTSEKILLAEAEVTTAALGDDEGAQQPHSFKSSSFSIPTQCGYCKSSIWGLSKQGKTCRSCGLSVHSKCELKVPAECPGSEGGGSSLSRKPTNASIISVRSSIDKPPPTPSSFVSGAAIEESEEDNPVARVQFDFIPTSEFELRVSEGSLVRVIEPDDGSGWVKVANTDDSTHSGLVPASYLEFVEDATPTAGANSAVHKVSGQYVRAIYAYQSQGSDELDLTNGELVELTSGPTGGKNYADGWWEGVNARGKQGIFPSNYVESQ